LSGISKGIRKAEVSLQWDPSPVGEPPTDLDIVAATYTAGDPDGAPDYVVHFDSRSPDGTIDLNRDSVDGKGLGWDEVMTLELDRLSDRYRRVVVGVVIQQHTAHRTFAGVAAPAYRVREGYTVLVEGGFEPVLGSTAAVIGEFARGEGGGWDFHPGLSGSDDDPASFTRSMGHLDR
jgi:stress response protein SCP2